LIGKLPFIALSIASSVLTVLAQQAGSAVVPIELVSSTSRALVAVKSLITYLWKMMVPVNLIPYYPYPDPAGVSLFSLEFLSAVVLVMGITAVSMAVAGKRKLWLAVWSYYVVTLVPVLGLVQVGGQAMADRYTYLPGIGPFIIMGLVIAWGSSRVTTAVKWKPAISIFAAVTAISLSVLLTYLTVRQVRIWSNGIGLWSYVIKNEPMRVPLAYYNRGIAFDRMGQYNKAVEDYDKVIALNPAHFEAYNNRGLAFDKLGRPDRAIDNFGAAIAVNPLYYQANFNRAIILERMGLYREAIEDYDRTIALNPSYAEAYNNRGIVFDKMGKFDEAVEDYRKAIALQPSYFEAYYNLGIAFGKTTRYSSAVEAFNEAIAINPNYPFAYGSRGLAYSYLSQDGKALDDFNRALALDQNYVRAYLHRGNLYLKAGNKESAVSDFRKACELGDKEGCRAFKLTD
jgi:tetratricopeptide (TPR) repeat protein